MLSIVGTESSRDISYMLSYCNYGVLLINQDFNEKLEKIDDVQNNSENSGDLCHAPPIAIL